MRRILILCCFLLFLPITASAKQLTGSYLTIGSTAESNQLQKENVIKLLEAQSANETIVISGETINKYLKDGSTNNTPVYSSALIQFRSDQSGNQIEIVTPNTIQQVTKETYTNAAITAGLKNATIKIASTEPVTGEGALVGIYALKDLKGTLDPETAELVQEEIRVVTDIEKHAKVDAPEEKKSELVNAAVAEIKTELASAAQNGNPLSEEQVAKLATTVLNNYNIELRQDEVQPIVNFFFNFQSSNIALDRETIDQLKATGEQLSNQLGSLIDKGKSIFETGKSVANENISKGKEFYEENEEEINGFWNTIKNFFKKAWEGISNIFQ